jgi:Holliday junction resolvase-like predicted endonuclease
MKQMLEDRLGILDIEAPVNGGRVDIIAKAPDARTVGVEVKAHQGELREVDKVQAALYFSPQLQAIAVANRRKLQMLTADYLQEVRVAAHITQEFLDAQPELARVAFTPHRDLCRTCANYLCLHRDNRTVQMRLDE